MELNKGSIKSLIIDFENQVYQINGQNLGEAFGLDLTFDGMEWTAVIKFEKEQHIYKGREPLYPKAKSRPPKQTADELTSD